MIVILSEIDCDYILYPGDNFKLLYEDRYGNDIEVLSTKIYKELFIKKAAVFICTEDNGSCTSSNISGMFCETFPPELINAKRLNQLSEVQSLNIFETYGHLIKNSL